MKATFFGLACLVTFALTSATYLPASRPAESQNTKGSTLAHSPQPPVYDIWRWIKAAVTVEEEEQKATSLAAVGWRGCKWCKQFKEKTLPPLVKEGYDVRYVDIKKWKGPKVTTGPTLFFFDDKDKIIRVHKGFLTVEEVKEYLDKPKHDND